jgi:hypothetical protein
MPFQGDLKKRTTSDIDLLIQSIKTDGLLMPFAIWIRSETCDILDGHARYEALVRMAIEDATILTQPLPCIPVDAENEDDAKKALLQITSSYGRVTKKGLVHFTASIPNYTAVAPIAVKVMAPVTAKPKVESDTVVLRLKISKDKVHRLTEVLRGVDGIEIL